MKQKKAGELVGSAFGNAIVLVVANTVVLWRHLTRGVVLASWTDVLWAVDLSLAVGIALYLSLAFYRPSWFYWFSETAISAAGLVSTIVVFSVFPFDFSQIGLGWINTAAKALLIVGMAGTAIAIVVNLSRLLMNKPYEPA